MPLSNQDIMDGLLYHIVANGQLGAGFKECSDLEAGHVTLSWGALVTPEFFDWVMQHSAAQALKVIQYNEKQEPVANWELGGARVVRVTATTFTGKGFPFRVEELELSVESVTAGEKL